MSLSLICPHSSHIFYSNLAHFLHTLSPTLCFFIFSHSLSTCSTFHLSTLVIFFKYHSSRTRSSSSPLISYLVFCVIDLPHLSSYTCFFLCFAGCRTPSHPLIPHSSSFLATHVLLFFTPHILPYPKFIAFPFLVVLHTYSFTNVGRPTSSSSPCLLCHAPTFFSSSLTYPKSIMA